MSPHRDLVLPAVVAVWVLVVLGLDTGASLGQQHLLGVGTWLLLVAVLRGESVTTRVQVGVVVVFATVVEVVFAGWLGVYVYRLDNVPAFVPPGHGLVYLAALCLGRSAPARRHARVVVTGTLVLCGAWALWSVTLADRTDVLGAFWFGCLLVFTRYGRSPLLYAGAFVVVSYLELVGTGLGTWTWQATDPTGLIGIGNPPSGIAGGYAWFDAAALTATPRLLAWWQPRPRKVVAADSNRSPFRCVLPLPAHRARYEEAAVARTRRSRTARGAGTVALLVGVLAAVQFVPGGAPLAARPASALVAYAGCAPLLEAYRAELERPVPPDPWLAAESRAGIRTQVGTPVPVAAGAVPVGDTGTNLQERGVDEPDVAKLSGGLLVSMGGGALRVVRTGATPELLGTLALPGGAGAGYGSELLLVGSRALVIERQGWPIASSSVPLDRKSPGALYPVQGAATTVLHLADLTDPASPRWLERWQVDGAYVSARLSGGTVRLVTRSVPRPGARPDTLVPDDVLPSAVHTDAAGGLRTGPAVDCPQVSAAQGARGGALLLVTTLRPSDGLAPTDSDAVSSDGDLVYAAADRLVVATSRWGTTAAPSGHAEVTTELHAFDTTEADRTSYVASGSVTGTVPGRWALSQHEGSLRVTTTSGQPPQSSVVVLRQRDGLLAEVGRVGGLGRGEQVQAVRYLGNVGVVVTFRQTDPLYVLDLADPAGPRLLGELKTPGFSTYLHPVGDGRLLGIGMEADANTGRTTGMQASLFELADLTAPTQLARLQLGDVTGEALVDARAFGYDPARRLAVLPLMTPGGGSVALGITVGVDGRLREAGRLPVPDGSWAQRVLSDGQQVYAVGEGGVVAGRADGLRPTGYARFAP